MHRLESCNIFLRTRAKKRDNCLNRCNEDEFQRKHRSCSGKAHAQGIQKVMRKRADSVPKKECCDQCVPNSKQFLQNAAISLYQKVPRPGQNNSVDDSINWSESDNDKLEYNVHNCLDTTNFANGIKVDLKKWDRGSQWRRSKSCSSIDSFMKRKPKVLNTRGHFGSLVDPADLTPFLRRKSIHFSPRYGEQLVDQRNSNAREVKLNTETKTKDNQSYENLLNAINKLFKAKCEDDMDLKEKFESLQVREFETTQVSRLFEKYCGISICKNETNDSISNIEELIAGLRKGIDNTLPKRKLFHTAQVCNWSHFVNDKNRFRKNSEISEKSEVIKRNEILERKWKPGGVVKQCPSPFFPMDSNKVRQTKRKNNLQTRGLNELKEKNNHARPETARTASRKKYPQSEEKRVCQKEGGLRERKTAADHKVKVSDHIRGNFKEDKDEVALSRLTIEERSPRKKSGSGGKSLNPVSMIDKSLIEAEMNGSNKLGVQPEEKTKTHKNHTLTEKLDISIQEYLKRTGGMKLEIVEDFDETKTENKVKSIKIIQKIKSKRESEAEKKCEIINDTRRYNVNGKTKLKVEKLSIHELPKTLSRGIGSVRKLISAFESNSVKEVENKQLNCEKYNAMDFNPAIYCRTFEKAKSDEELENERACLDSDKLWLVHKAGFSAVRAISDASKEPAELGKVKVKLENSEQILEVDEDDLEKANPAQFDKIEDICQLRYINESSVLYLLRQRYGNNLIHTYSAGNLIVINPQCTLSIYTEKVAALFRGCKSEDMPPHIYSLAQTTYRSMLSTRKDQSIVLLGRSGSGKTHNFRHILSYLLHCSGSVNKVLTLERLNALNTVLEAFGNARTCMNISATRCTNLINLDFDQTGQIASLSLQILMLEKQRIAKRPEDEANFNVFYWLLGGAEGSLAKQLFLDSTPSNSNLFVNFFHKNEDRQRAVMEFSKLSLAFRSLGVHEKECFAIWSIISAIYHLGHAGAIQVGTNKWQFADPVHASKACRLMGTTSEEMSQTIWDSPMSPTKSTSPSDKEKLINGMEALEGFVVGLYSELVNVVNGLINRCLTTNYHSAMSIVIVDSPGIQNPASCQQQRDASFSDLCHNYVQERLHLMFHNVNLVVPRDRYAQEHVDLNMDEMFTEMNSPNQLISILDKSPPSGVLKTSQTDLREIDRRGLLWLLEEESIYPNSNDETFLERLFQHCNSKDHQLYIRKASKVGHFVVQHCQGTNPVTYYAKGWLKASRENPMNRVAINFLQESAKEEISELFVAGKGLHLSISEGSQSLRRVSSIRRTCSSAVKRKSISLQIKFSTDGLIETLRRTRSRFVFCMLAQHNAGLWDLTPGAGVSENIINVPLLRSQVRGAEILPAARIYKQGFPEFVPHGEFKRRFRLLAPTGGEPVEQPNSTGIIITVNGQQAPITEPIDEAREVEEMLMVMDVDIMSYRIGLTQELRAEKYGFSYGQIALDSNAIKIYEILF